MRVAHGPCQDTIHRSELGSPPSLENTPKCAMDNMELRALAHLGLLLGVVPYS